MLYVSFENSHDFPVMPAPTLEPTFTTMAIPEYNLEL